MFTMEDPCEECTFVRDVFDCRLLRSLDVMQPYWKQQQQNGEGEVMPLSQETIETVRRTTGMTEEQLQKCYNILLHRMFSAETSRAYRVYVGGCEREVMGRLKSRLRRRGEMSWS